MSAVQVTAAGGVGVVVIDNPPANASSVIVRRGLLEALARLEADSEVRSMVLVGARDSFVAGLSIGEFGGEIPEPLLPEVNAALASSRLPIVAALDGFALAAGSSWRSPATRASPRRAAVSVCPR